MDSKAGVGLGAWKNAAIPTHGPGKTKNKGKAKTHPRDSPFPRPRAAREGLKDPPPCFRQKPLPFILHLKSHPRPHPPRREGHPSFAMEPGILEEIPQDAPQKSRIRFGMKGGCSFLLQPKPPALSLQLMCV